MIDVHVLTMSTTPPAWAALCIASIEQAIDNAGFPVTLHVTTGVKGHIGKARAKGYALGEQPYVTYVDHDDYIHEDAFKALKPLLDRSPEAITTGETIVLEDGSTGDLPNAKHHLAVFKRDFIEQLSLENFQHFPDQYALHEANSIHLDRCLYFHRVYDTSGSRQLREAQPHSAEQELKSFLAEFAEVELLTPLQLKVKLDRELRNA